MSVTTTRGKKKQLHLFCPSFLQKSLILVYIFQSLVAISVMEDCVSITLPASLLFSLGKSFDSTLGNTLQTKPFHMKFHTSNTIFEWRLTKMEGERCIYSSVLFHKSYVFAANLCFALTCFHRGAQTSTFLTEMRTSGIRVPGLDRGLPRESTSWNLCKRRLRVCRSCVLLGRSAPIAPHYMRT